MLTPYKGYKESYSRMCELFTYYKNHAAPQSVIKRAMYECYNRGFTIADIWRAYLTGGRRVATRPVSPTYGTVRNWVHQGKLAPPINTQKIPATWIPPDHRMHGPFKQIRIYPQIPETEKAPFQAMAEETRKIRGATAEDSELWMIRRTYHVYIKNYYQRGIRISDIARAAGVSHRAIAHRLTEMGLK